MSILDLSVELFELILRDCIIVRGLKRGLRLRLVNKTFAKGVLDALYSFRLLDQLLDHYLDSYSSDYEFFPESMEKKRPREIPLSLRGSYLAYRVVQEPRHGNAALINIKKAAQEIHGSDDSGKVQLSTVDEYVTLLCSTMDSFYLPDDIESRYEKDRDARYSPTARFVRALRGHCPEDELDVHLEGYTYVIYAAAIRTNCLSLIKHCIARYPALLDTTIKCRSRWRNNLILGDCFIIAARYANVEVLTYFLSVREDKHFRFRHFILAEAAYAGRADIASFLYHFKSDEVPLKFDHTRFSTRRSNSWIHGTSDLDVIKFAATLTPEPDPRIKNYVLAYALQSAAAAGRLDTVKYLIEKKVPATGLVVFATRFGYGGTLGCNLENWTRRCKPRNDPVRLAATNGHARIVDLLIRHGASASIAMSTAARHGHDHIVRSLLRTCPPSEDSLLNAAIGGYTTVAQMLLENGANANGGPKNEDASTQGMTVAQMLSEYEANENGGLKNKDASTQGLTVKQKTPLAYAMSMENTILYSLLVQHGATLNILETLDSCI